MQVHNKQKEQNSDLASFSRSTENYEPINKEDKNRRFDLLLNKLRYGEKEMKPTEVAKKSEPEEYASVFSKEVIKRYQV